MQKALRWAWYFSGSRFFDALVVLVTAILLPFYYLFFRKWGNVGPLPEPQLSIADLISRGSHDPLMRENYSLSKDAHNLMVQVGHGYFHPEWAEKMAELALTADGSLYRHLYEENGYGEDPSVDMLSAWCYFYVVCGLRRPDLVRRLASHFLSRTFNLANNDGTLSGRCACAGVSLIGGGSWPRGKKLFGWAIPFGITKPIAGQESIIASALLSLAAKECGGWFRVWFWVHYLFSFVWFWRLWPWLPVRGYEYAYVGHVSQMALHTLHRTGHKQRFGLRWNAVSVRSQQGYQPFMAGMAADVLTWYEKQEAMKWLISQSVTWPQYFGLLPFDKNHDCWSMMAYCAVQLK